MPDPAQTVRLHRVLKCPPDRLFRAFQDPKALSKWLPPYGFVCEVHTMDFRVDGSHRATFTNFNTGQSHSFGGRYLEIRANELIRYTDTFDDPGLPGEMTVTVKLRPVSCGTELSIVQENIPAAIPAEMCYLGWQESLAQLANVVEPAIP